MIEPQLFTLYLLMPVLFACAITDLRSLRIPNMLVLCGLALACVSFPVTGMDEVTARLAIAGMVFIIGFLLFHFGLMGGGDTKLLPVLFLAVPSAQVPEFLFCLSAGLALAIAAVAALKRVPACAASGWHACIPGSNALPVAPAMAAAALLFLQFAT